ncbi:helix-turn-helix transcriptional regulator [Weissella soli]|uniref:AraC family transcriptional regulator n=1 Tax=Weissella soli TaxID=155866 RepID=A0A288Q699_9LACO|nr:AraC family transcriptional regulator [Weissella soli]AOT56407.1 putative HTH-type transcriptional regulator YobQ [Weissella soli]MCT8395026.1 AraC family transcriptional regulator [Weissella soli]NKY82858.1 AraC family transcriptional regulator [Weissella soli]QEA34671.1 AraC family transcriptional regulator [Weissella soli]RDL11975.1 AraC family transcriptional regulator [Weissella soli]
MEKFKTKELQNSIRMPAMDWNITFFGGHQQAISKQWHYPLERHLAFETFYIVKGAIVVEVLDSQIHLNAGDIMVLSPNVWHETRSLAETTYFNFHFNLDDDRFVRNLMNQAILSFPSGSENSVEVAKSVEQLRCLLNENMEYSFIDELKIHKALSEFILNLFANDHATTNAIDASQLKIASSIAYGIRSKLQHQVHAYFNEDFLVPDKFQKVSIDKIYQELQISPSYGGSVFKKIYGYSPRQYLTKLKIAQAKRLLRLPDINIFTISAALGYNDSAHFTRQFKRWTGETPYQFRKNDEQ